MRKSNCFQYGGKQKQKGEMALLARLPSTFNLFALSLIGLIHKLYYRADDIGMTFAFLKMHMAVLFIIIL